MSDLLATFRRFAGKPHSQELVIRLALLVLIYLWAFLIRLFSVLRYESVIHEFDPYFNYRSTIMLVDQGFREFWNWFDWESWYPLGRVVGGTVYPGLMITAAAMYHALVALRLPVLLRDVCVFTSPFFAGNTAMVAYAFGDLLGGKGVGLAASVLMAVVPGYISRSVAGSFDNEAVAIFALVTTFYLFVRAVKLGTTASAVAAGFGYLYMAASWGAYVFISNLIPIYVLAMIATKRYSRRLYVAYTAFWAVGGALAMQVRFIGGNHITSHELLAFNAVWLGLQVWELLVWMRTRLGIKAFAGLVTGVVSGLVFTAVGGIVALTVAGKMTPWTGRFWTLLDPTYAKKFIPIIASVSEHQPTTWASYFMDVHLLVWAAPAGLYLCFTKPSEPRAFLIIFALTAIYFSGIMVRLMLVAAPAFVLLGAIAVSHTLLGWAKELRAGVKAARAGAGAADAPEPPKGAKKAKPGKRSGGAIASTPFPWEVSALVLAGVLWGLAAYGSHSNWATSEAYSSPTIVLIAGRGADRYVFDDFREAYYWLRHNSAKDARILSWWDYGYQITAMANRTVIVDNNTWNNTHIATVGRTMASSEEDAYPLLQLLDADYVLVIFGGVAGYSGDDINKFLWMVRIANGVYPDRIAEANYMDKTGSYQVGVGASPIMVDSLMYRCSYYQFSQVMMGEGTPSGYDRVRGYEVALKEYDLKYLEEAFTSQNWLVRIFKVKKQPNRGYAPPPGLDVPPAAAAAS